MLRRAVVVGVLAAQVLTPPVIGGSPSAFEQVLGAANDASVGPQLHYLRCAGTDIDQYVLMAPSDQVWTISREYCVGTSFSAADRFAEAAQFLPADALAGDQLTTQDGDPGQTYVSQTVANALPAALFHDCAGQSVTPGTVVIVADSDGGWFLGPGTCA